MSFETWYATYHRINTLLWKGFGDRKITKQDIKKLRYTQTLEALALPTDSYSLLRERYLQAYQNHWHWIEGAKEAFDFVSERVPVGIITNGFAETQKKKFEQLGLHSKTNIFIISEEVGHPKPQAEIFRFAEEIAAVPRARILYVGDSWSSDVMGARKAEWKMAWRVQDADPEKAAQVDFHFDQFSTFTRWISTQFSHEKRA